MCYILSRHSTFQYPDQIPCPEDFNADTTFHILVSDKRIFLFFLTFNFQHNIKEYAIPFTHLTQNSIFNNLGHS